MQVPSGLAQGATGMGQSGADPGQECACAFVQSDGRPLDGLLKARVVSPDRVEQKPVEHRDDKDRHHPCKQDIGDEMAAEGNAQASY